MKIKKPFTDFIALDLTQKSGESFPSTINRIPHIRQNRFVVS
jgi:hypothetical protein